MHPLIAKLSRVARLDVDDVHALEGLCSSGRNFAARSRLISEGEPPHYVFVVLDGWAMRYKYLPDGGRQILAYLLPGDFCSHAFVSREMDHSISLLTDARVAIIPKASLSALLEHRPALSRAFWRARLVDESVTREWIVNAARRPAHDGIAHLLAELWLRLHAVGLVHEGSARLPLVQSDIADTLGLTSIHVNRMLQKLRELGVLELRRGTFSVANINRLMEVSRFDPNYLHLDGGLLE